MFGPDDGFSLLPDSPDAAAAAAAAGSRKGRATDAGLDGDNECRKVLDHATAAGMVIDSLRGYKIDPEIVEPVRVALEVVAETALSYDLDVYDRPSSYDGNTHGNKDPIRVEIEGGSLVQCLLMYDYKQVASLTVKNQTLPNAKALAKAFVQGRFANLQTLKLEWQKQRQKGQHRNQIMGVLLPTLVWLQELQKIEFLGIQLGKGPDIYSILTEALRYMPQLGTLILPYQQSGFQGLKQQVVAINHARGEQKRQGQGEGWPDITLQVLNENDTAAGAATAAAALNKRQKIDDAATAAAAAAAGGAARAATATAFSAAADADETVDGFFA